jgi:hypothetical protein
VVLNGVLAGDAPSVRLSTNGYTATFASAGVANGIGVTVSGLTLTGASATNYTFTQPAGLTANITSKGVTITSGITANNKVYDGTTAATISSNNVVLNGVLTGDAPNVGLSTNGYAANFASPNVGTGIGVTVSGLTLTGARATNYTLTQPVGLTANITLARMVTITSGITANNKVYDGTTTATISSNNVVLNGVRPGDAASVRLSTNGYTATFASAGVANGIGVTISGLTLTGAGATNYMLIQPTLAANITPVTLTVSANNKIRTYGLPNPPLTVSYSGFVNSEGTNVLTGTPSLNTSATTNSLPGTYTIIAGAGTLNATNYNFAFFNGTLTVVALPRLSNVLLNGNQFILAWPTVAGQTYQLEYKDNLSAATWILSGPFVGTGNPIIATNNLGASPQRFFRLGISP